MALAQPLGFEIDFVINPISWSAAWFFVTILGFIFEIKVHVKKFPGSARLAPNKNSFSKPDFHNRIYIWVK